MLGHLDPQVQAALVTAGGAATLTLLGFCTELLRRTWRSMHRVRDQLENDHGTNLRHDIDKLGDRFDELGDVMRQIVSLSSANAVNLSALGSRLDQHISDCWADLRRDIDDGAGFDVKRKD